MSKPLVGSNFKRSLKNSTVHLYQGPRAFDVNDRTIVNRAERTLPASLGVSRDSTAKKRRRARETGDSIQRGKRRDPAQNETPD